MHKGHFWRPNLLTGDTEWFWLGEREEGDESKKNCVRSTSVDILTILTQFAVHNCTIQWKASSSLWLNSAVRSTVLGIWCTSCLFGWLLRQAWRSLILIKSKPRPYPRCRLSPTPRNSPLLLSSCLLSRLVLSRLQDLTFSNLAIHTKSVVDHAKHFTTSNVMSDETFNHTTFLHIGN